MARIVKGNLLNAIEDIIGHQVNCQGVMGSGVAKGIKDKWRAAYNGYCNYCHDKNPYELLGDSLIIDVGSKYVAHLFGQLNYGRVKERYTDYDALRNALHSLKEVAKRSDLSIALPYGIGCGLANGEWSTVYQIIDDVFSDYEVALYKLE